MFCFSMCVCFSCYYCFFNYGLFVLFCSHLFACFLKRERKKWHEVGWVKRWEIWDQLGKGNWFDYSLWKYFFNINIFQIAAFKATFYFFFLLCALQNISVSQEYKCDLLELVLYSHHLGWEHQTLVPRLMWQMPLPAEQFCYPYNFVIYRRIFVVFVCVYVLCWATNLEPCAC